jgi:ADP-ribosylglycohydrolase
LKSLWEFHEAGDATRVTLDHNGCGAAIRVAVGILYRSNRLDDIVEGAHQASISTHGGPLALATLMESAELAILLAANIGGDSDSVASLPARFLGARYPARSMRTGMESSKRSTIIV